jgi:SAM-dependent methyltransferase
MKIETTKAWDTAMTGYDQRLMEIVSAYPSADILELGAGRYPSFRISDMPENIGTYTANDISEHELALLPSEYAKVCFDVSGDVANFKDTYDVVFSRFLAEHVPDGIAMHRNVYSVLRKGGTAFHLIPTLYALPFVINKYLPENLTRQILNVFSPRRSISPKFPAYYSACYGDPKKMKRILLSIGYSDVEIEPFYGHFYYEQIPGLKQLHEQFSAFAARNEWAALASYAYIRVVK